MTNDLEAELNDQLSREHLAELHDGSGISHKVISARGYRTVQDPKELEGLNFAPEQQRVPGLLLPSYDVDGLNGHCVYKPDNPRVIEQKKKGKLPDGTWPQKVIKYEQPKGTAARVDCPPMGHKDLDDPSIELFITEGQKKADSLVTRGACAIALMGVWNWRGTNSKGGKTLLADFDQIAFNGRDVYIVYDSDAQTNPHVGKASDRLGQVLQNKGAHVNFVHLPPASNGDKWGVDDWFVANPEKTLEDLKALAEGPRPEVKAAPPTVELLDEAPDIMKRPVAIINGRGYIAAWPWVEITVAEKIGKDGRVYKLKTLEVSQEQRLVIIRDDGVIFQSNEAGEFPGLDFLVDLPFVPQSKQIISTPAIKRLKARDLPDPLNLLSQLKDTIDCFIDFDSSLASQETMCELISCYVMATYFLPAWEVVGYLWPGGDRGSGKTQLLSLVTSLSYLGILVTAGGTFAALRDLAEYGATLGIDDAENLSDPKSIDADKRTLFLAGNQRDVQIPLKELGPNKKWTIRMVSAFAFRGFSSIGKPDNVIGSRSIGIPLVRTADQRKGNATPSDYESWPHDRRRMIDDLWSLGVTYLPEMQGYWRKVGKQSSLVGRNLDPWRAALSIALWLEKKGALGLFDRLSQLSVVYQYERVEIERGDWNYPILKGLCLMMGDDLRKNGVADVVDIADVADVIQGGVFYRTSDITNKAHSVIDDEALSISKGQTDSRIVGARMGKMRFSKNKDKSRKRDRGWIVDVMHLHRRAASYSIDFLEVAGLKADVSLDNKQSQDADVRNVQDVHDVRNLFDGNDPNQINPFDPDLFSNVPKKKPGKSWVESVLDEEEDGEWIFRV